MLLSLYEMIEIILSVIIFPVFYFLFLYFTVETKIIYWDIIWCTISLFIILLIKTLYINYYLLQNQNFSSNTILNGIY